ncbi:SusC/RagA family TonB-linked outer membrane protein [Rhodocytophaga aerolata]
MMKRILLISFILLACLTNHLKAQDRTVTGKVTSTEDGSALPGVNVLVKGSTSGTTTGADGGYSISVPTNATLIFSFIGLQTQEVPVGTRSVVDVQLASDVQALSEVVVTAQGIERTKNELPYAAQQVSGESIAKVRENNFVNALSGKVAGLQITRNNNMGGSTNVVIRGNKSLTGNNQALFIVDGVPIDNSNVNSNNAVSQRGSQVTGRGGYDYGNAAADINPDDIASINVLKGAAATALYGSRAANGVILITTKKGRKGLGVTVNSGMTVGMLNKNTFPTFQRQYGGGYGAYYGPNEDAYFNEADVNGDGITDLIVPTTEDASYGGPFDPNLSVYQWNAFDPTSPFYRTPTPWVAPANDPIKFFKNSITSSHSIMVDGGSDKGYFKLGYGRNTEQGILPNSELKKNFINFGAGYNVTDKLTASASINFTLTEGLGRYGTGYDDKNIATNMRQWWQTNVDILEQKDAYFRSGKNVTWNWANPLSDNPVPIYWDNPYWTRYENYQNDVRSRYFGNVSLTYKIADWIDVLGRISLDRNDFMAEERYAVGSLSPSEYSRFNRTFSEYNYDLLVNMNKDLSESFNLKGVIGTNIRRTTIESIYAETNGGLVVPNLYSLSNSLNPIEAPEEVYSDLQVNGIFASATIGFRDFIFLDLAARRDEASSLPAGANVYYYPSISTSFVFSELMKNTPWLTAGKVRLNYAEVGNTAPVQSILDVFDKPTGFGSTPLFSVPNIKNNPELKPERTKSYEAGVEMAFLDNRLGFDVTYYKQNTVDQIIPVGISRATGYTSRYINAGDVENRGWEVTAFVSPIKTPSFTWTVNVNWTRNRNEVKALYPGITNLPLGNFQGGVSINAALGEPYGTIRGQNFVYHENGEKIVLPTGYYARSATSNEIIGNINPDWIGGIQNTLRYKNVSLSFLIDTRQGGDVFSLDMYYGLATGGYPETAGLNDLGNPLRNSIANGGGYIVPGVLEDGTPNERRVSATNYGLFGYARNPAAGFVYDASYIKLREANLTFSVPQAWVDRIQPFRGIDVSVIGRNLFIFHKKLPYADPEDGLSSGNLQGYQVGSYPTTRNLGFNVQLRF